MSIIHQIGYSFYLMKLLIFNRFVLFKKHYEKYLDISKKYEEARNISYFLEEKYHEVKVIAIFILNSSELSIWICPIMPFEIRLEPTR